jgi:FlaA1/EpsC-like NDP-sugar epimerase
MIKANGFSHGSSTSKVLALIDGLLIVMGVFAGQTLRFWQEGNNVIPTDYLVWKIMLVVLVIQTVFYYFDLYELKNFRRRIKMTIVLLGAMAISSVLLAVIYYAIPFLAIGRGVLTISLLIIFPMGFSCRLLYAWVAKNRIFKERILIIGTGELAKKILKEISENGQDSFEVVGFVSERRGEIG